MKTRCSSLCRDFFGFIYGTICNSSVWINLIKADLDLVFVLKFFLQPLLDVWHARVRSNDDHVVYVLEFCHEIFDYLLPFWDQLLR